MASLSSMLGGIKSVQRGVIGGGAVTIKISPVNPAKTFVNMPSVYSPGDQWYSGSVELTSSTTIKVASGTASGGRPLYWEVIEFY